MHFRWPAACRSVGTSIGCLRSRGGWPIIRCCAFRAGLVTAMILRPVAFLGNQMQHHLAGVLEEFRAAGKLILGVCNGFQILLKTNLLVAPDEKGATATLTLNDSGKFEARWVRLSVEPNKCVFLQGIREMELPVAHAEGKFVVRDAKMFASMEAEGRFVMRYAAKSGGGARVPVSAIIRTARWANIAGVCDETGRVFGLMPHPERFVDPTQHPRWTREPAREVGDGLRVFQNAVRYFL